MTGSSVVCDDSTLFHSASLSLGLSSPFVAPKWQTQRKTGVSGRNRGEKAGNASNKQGSGSGEGREGFQKGTRQDAESEVKLSSSFWSDLSSESEVDEVRNVQRAVMSAGAGGDSKQRTIRAMFNNVMKRHSRIIPLGRLKKTSPSNGEEGPSLLDPDELGDDSFPPRTGRKRVLILMSDTGGGHRASAEAIKQAIEEEYGDDYEVTVIDLWKEHTPWPFNQMPKSYSFLVKHETLWKVAFHITKPRFVHQPQMAATSAFVAREVSKGLDKHRPDVIVSVHPLMQHIPLRVLRKRNLLEKVPFTTVITDLTTCHPTWFHKLATLCFCPTREVAQRAYKAGLRPPQVKVYGLPIRPAFCKPTKPKSSLRHSLGLHPDLPAVLLVGGGEGMGPVEATARALAESLGGPEPRGQLVVICGRNKKLMGRLELTEWSLPVKVTGFVSNMPEWMAACDCIITKAGPGTIAEAMIRGLPMILNDFIAGQEVGNVPFVVNNGAGKYSENPKEIAEIVTDWFGAKYEELKAMSENALRLARPDAVFKIVRDLDRLARRRDSLLESTKLAALAGQAGQG